MTPPETPRMTADDLQFCESMQGREVGFYERVVATYDALAASQQNVERLTRENADYLASIKDGDAMLDDATAAMARRDALISTLRASLALAQADSKRLDGERRSAVRTLAFAVMAVGGRIRITKTAMLEMDGLKIHASEDFETGDLIVSVAASRPSETATTTPQTEEGNG